MTSPLDSDGSPRCGEGGGHFLGAVRERYTRAQQLRNSERLARLSQVHSGLSQYGAEYRRLKEAGDSANQACNAQVQQLRKGLEDESRSMQQLGSRLDQGLAELDTQIHKQLEQLKQLRTGGVEELQQLLQSRAGQLEARILEQHRRTQDSAQPELEAADHALQELERTLAAAQTTKEMIYTGKLATLKEELQSVQQAVDAEKELRVEMQKLLVSRIGEIEDHLQASIQAEVEERMRMHGALEQLLEDTARRYKPGDKASAVWREKHR